MKTRHCASGLEVNSSSFLFVNAPSSRLFLFACSRDVGVGGGVEGGVAGGGGAYEGSKPRAVKALS